MHRELLLSFVVNKENVFLFIILTGIFIKNRWLCFCCCCYYFLWVPFDAVCGQCPSIQVAHPFGDLFETDYMRECTSTIGVNSIFTRSFHTDNRLFSTHRYLCWMGRSIWFLLGFEVRQWITDENTLIFIGTILFCMLRVAAWRTGIMKIMTSFIGSSRSSVRSATILVTGVGIIVFGSIQASVTRRCCCRVQCCIQLRHLVEVE